MAMFSYSDLDNFDPPARIVVIGVGGAGNNAVNRMVDEHIQSCEFYVLNTDKQVLATSKAPNRLVLGEEIAHGLGAGGNPEKGRAAAEASRDEIAKIVEGANLVFIAAGMGGGTGTGAAPVIARIAKDAGALTIAIVTRPFSFEGNVRIGNSVKGLTDLKDTVDSIIIVSNDKLLVVAGKRPIQEAFSESDKILAEAVRTVVNLIMVPGLINLDFEDVCAIMKNSGIALIGSGAASGPNKSKDAAENALNSPLLEVSIVGARKAICLVTCGTNVSLYDAEECVQYIIRSAASNVAVKFGVAINPNLDDEIMVSVIATDFSEDYDFTRIPQVNTSRKIAQEFHHEDSPVEEAPESEDSVISQILPDFLKEGDGEGE
ncbi:MAG: cell division protein FtsZ [Bacilli bacterium]|nr:cell division protein FtsZ [Bacilli bacterium]